MNTVKADGIFAISSENCARGFLNKATSFMTAGGNTHDIQSFIAKSALIDHLPKWLTLICLGFVGKFSGEKYGK